jgi:hypothetical protein
MPPPPIKSAFLSVVPSEPVLVFSTAEDAAYFQSHCRQGRIQPLPHMKWSNTWVYLPMPAGLLRVRTARSGDVAFDFASSHEARDFNSSIKGVGKVFSNTKEKPYFDKSVYFGK